MFENDSSNEDQWISISDLMSGLMLIFMFIAITFMIYEREDKILIQKEKNEIVDKTKVLELEKVTILKKTKVLQLEKNEIEKKTKILQKEKEIIIEQKEKVIEERDFIQKEKETVIKQKEKVIKERDFIQKQKKLIEAQKKKIERIVETYDNLKTNLHKKLNSEFEKDLGKWKAEIDKKTLSIRFKEPDVFFNTGDAEIKSKFQEILKDFFPRYIKILTSEKYKDDIEEIRIEGHTSSLWKGSKDRDAAYFYNMKLSQDRARAVLEFALGLDELKGLKNWIIKHVTANGLSYSQRIMIKNSEDYRKSRRVEIRVRTKAEKRIEQILGFLTNEIN